MWPFKKTETIDFKDHVKTLKEPPCGNAEVHYYWVKSSEERGGCPICSVNIQRRKELSEMELLADMIATKVVERMNK